MFRKYMFACILNIGWADVTNKELWKTNAQVQISQEISKDTWTWISHTLSQQRSYEKKVLVCNPQDKRQRSRQKSLEEQNTKNLQISTKSGEK